MRNVRARELLRMAEPIIRHQAELGDTPCQYVAIRMDEVLDPAPNG